MNKWNYSPSSESGFWSIVAQDGKVIALRVTTEGYARLIADNHNDYQNALELLDKAGVWTGADDLLSDRIAALIIERDVAQKNERPRANRTM